MRRTMVVLGTVLAVGLAGCGAEDTTPDEDEETAAQEQADEPSAAPDEESDDDAAASEGDSEADGDDEPAADDGDTTEEPSPESFTGPSEPVRITYELTGDAELEQLTLAWDPPRFAMIFDQGKAIVDEDGTIFCDAAGEGCFRFGSGFQDGQMAAGLGPFLGFTTALQEGQQLPGTTVTGEAEIAGRSATCATYDAADYDPSLQGEAEFCYDADAGVLLRWSGTQADGSTQTLEALEVGDPDPADFEPTGDVQELPGMGDQDG